MITKHIISTNAHKVLSFLLAHPEKSFYERDIARKTGISYGSANAVLNSLYKDDVLQKTNTGKMSYYLIKTTSPFIKELKVLNNLLMLEPLIEKLKTCTHKVVLFGSWVLGSDSENSDIDILIVTSQESNVRKLVDSFSEKLGKNIQAIIKKPADLINTNKRDSIFVNQLDKGKVLWEKEIDDSDI